MKMYMYVVGPQKGHSKRVGITSFHEIGENSIILTERDALSRALLKHSSRKIVFGHTLLPLYNMVCYNTVWDIT